MASTDNRGEPPKPAEASPEPVEETTPEVTAEPEVDVEPEEAEEVTRLRQQLEEKTREAQENYDRLLRCAAEMENLKKRLEKERAEVVQFANENLCKELLPVLDNLERALENGRQFEAPTGLMEGLELVYQNFLKILGKYGVTPIDSVGQPFDPAIHHAVMEEEAPELADQTVTRELQKGYLMQTRLLRPAMVVVARNPNQPKEKVDLKV